MKKLLSLGVVLVSIALIFSCKSAPKPPPAAPEPKGELKVEAPVYPPKIIEHKRSAFGGDPPEWVFMEQAELEGSDEYKDSYVFVFDETGTNLDGLKAWTRSFVAATEVARMVSTRVMDKFAGAQVGDKNMVETYMEEVAKVMALAEYSGARRKADFWVHQQTFTDKGKADQKIYRYLLLYTVPRERIDDAIERALGREDTRNKPKTEEEQAARDRVRELFSEGF